MKISSRKKMIVLITIVGCVILNLNSRNLVAQSFLYEFEALPGEIIDSTVTGFIELPNSAAGLTVWNPEIADNAEFALVNEKNDLCITWESANSQESDIRFDNPIGADVLTPVLPDVNPGGPDWVYFTIQNDTTYFLGIGHDLAKPFWNFGIPGPDPFGDFRGSTGPNGEPQWLLRIVTQSDLGDMNRDGVVDLQDVAPFVDALVGCGINIRGDINRDGKVDLLDVAPFVALLTGS